MKGDRRQEECWSCGDWWWWMWCGFTETPADDINIFTVHSYWTEVQVGGYVHVGEKKAEGIVPPSCNLKGFSTLAHWSPVLIVLLLESRELCFRQQSVTHVVQVWILLRSLKSHQWRKQDQILKTKTKTGVYMTKTRMIRPQVMKVFALLLIKKSRTVFHLLPSSRYNVCVFWYVRC